MCVTLATGLAIAGGGASFLGQRAAARRPTSAIQQQGAANAAAIRADAENQLEDIVARSDELRGAAATDLAHAAREALETRARLAARISEGASGRSTDAILREAGFDSGLERVNIQRNLATNLRQLVRQSQAIGRSERVGQESNRRTSQAQLSRVNRPSLIGTGLQIGTALATDPRLNS